MPKPYEDTFLKDVKNHTIEYMNDGPTPYRHLVFSNNGSFHHRFTITTWPGKLHVGGDMGDYTFCRVPDMFTFFRPEKRDHRFYRNGNQKRAKLPINLGYWAEKVQAQDRHSPVMELSRTKVRRVINRIMFTGGWPKAVRDRVRDEVLYYDHPQETLDAANEFVERDGDVRYRFDELWEYDTTEYNYHFVWCCYAIVWAIKQYDARRAASPFLYRVPTAVEFAD